MGYRALNWAWDAQLPMTQKFVLVALADMADEQNSCFPGQERLAEMIGATDRTVRSALGALEQCGAISRTQRRLTDGTRTSDRYRLHIDRQILPVESPETDDRVTGNLRQGHRKEIPGNPQITTSRTPSLLSDGDDEVAETVLAVRVGVIWELWPSSRRSTRKVVERSLRSALKVSNWGQIIRAAEEHARVWKTWQASEHRFVPLLSTWLNQERWTGAVPEPRGGGRASAIDVGRDADRLLAEREQFAIGGAR